MHTLLYVMYFDLMSVLRKGRVHHLLSRITIMNAVLPFLVAWFFSSPNVLGYCGFVVFAFYILLISDNQRSIVLMRVTF